MAVLGYLSKLKWGLGLAFDSIFCGIHSEKCSIFLYQWTKFQCHTLFLSQTVDDDINFKIFLESTSKAMADKEKKRGRPKYKNLNI